MAKPRCPKCNATSVRYRVKSGFICIICGNKWKKKAEKKNEVD